jgi:hypothetical protein
MLATENATRLVARLEVVARATEDALRAAEALDAPGAGGRGDARHWLPGIKASLRRLQLECADVHYAALALREGIASPEALQPRLMD